MLSARTFVFLGLLVLAVAVVLPSSDVQLKELAVRVTGDLEVYEAPWNGPTGLEKRRNFLALFGIATAYITAAVVGTCGLAAVMPGAVPVCVAGIAFSAVVGGIFLVAAIIAGTTKRGIEMDPLAGIHKFDYMSLPGGPSVLAQVRTAFAEAGDGLPIKIGRTDCYNYDYDCQTLWYSNSLNATGDGRNTHRIHVTPAHYDFRAPEKEAKPSPVLVERQKTYSTAAAAETPKKGKHDYYGGYVFQTDNDAAEKDIGKDGNHKKDAHKGAQDIINGMSTQYKQENGKWGNEGAYCMLIEDAKSKKVGVGGYFWIEDKASKAPAGSNERDFLGTCTEEAAST